MSNSLPIVSIIILNWNGLNDSIECIKSVRKNDYPNYNLIIVDNGSEKENLDKLKDYCKSNISEFVVYSRNEAENGGISSFEEILKETRAENKLILIENSENLGFASGNNVAIRYAMKKNIAYVLLLNNDTVVKPDFLSKMINLFERNPSLGAVIPQIRYYEQKDHIWNCGGKIFMGFRKYYYAEKNISDIPEISILTISFATGCALLFKPQDVGLLTEKFFFGEEDFEFAYRIKKMKKKMACAMNSIIYHKVGRSLFSVNNSNIVAKHFIYYLNRFINMRDQFNNKLVWGIWRLLYSIYILKNLFNLMGVKKSLMFMRILWHKSYTLNLVDKNCFEWAFSTWKQNK